jgi:splicing factor 3B subunit 1
VGRIADRGAEFVPAREWMRICFELLELLKAHKKGIRRATVNTFGCVACLRAPSPWRMCRYVPKRQLGAAG